MSILLTKRPDEVKMILVDPKMVEMTVFNTIAHLMCPIVTETQRAVQILGWSTEKMDERYALLAEARVKNIAEYNNLGSEEIINYIFVLLVKKSSGSRTSIPFPSSRRPLS